MRSPDSGGDWLLGVDGGGTKTHFLLSRKDGSGNIVHIGPGTYHIESGFDGVADVLRSGLRALCRDAGIDPSHIAYAFFGLPGFGEAPASDARLEQLARDLLSHDRYRCDNDMVCAWAGSLGGADGINIVAGTGSIGYGERAGRSARCGGWGELFGDEGSAYWTAIRGLNAFTRMSDGRLPRGPLYDIYRGELGLNNDLEVLERYLENDSSRKTLAGLAPLVAQAAAMGDAAANEILGGAAAALASHAATLAKVLEYQPDEEVPVSYSGGMFSRGDSFRNLFANALSALDRRLSLKRPIHPPHVGAVLAAARYGGVCSQPGSLRRLSEALSHQNAC